MKPLTFRKERLHSPRSLRLCCHAGMVLLLWADASVSDEHGLSPTVTLNHQGVFFPVFFVVAVDLPAVCICTHPCIRQAAPCMLGSARVKAKADCRNPPLFHSLPYFWDTLSPWTWSWLFGWGWQASNPSMPFPCTLESSCFCTPPSAPRSLEDAATPWFDTGAGIWTLVLMLAQHALFSSIWDTVLYKHISSLVKLHGGNQPDTLNTLLSKKKMFLGTINETHTIKHHAVCFAWGL